VWPGVRQAGLVKAEPGADAGPGAAQRRRLTMYGLAACAQLAHVAESATAEQLRELEDLRHGQHRPLTSMLVTSAPDAAWISQQDLVFLDGGGEHTAQQPVCLRRYRFGDPNAQQIAPPLADPGASGSGLGRPARRSGPGRLTPIRRSKRLIAVVIGRGVQTSTFILPG
jgi:hypothetical protein